MSGQTLTDRLTAAKHSLAGQGLAKSVCKATTEEVIGPKKKHLDYLLACTNEANVSIPQMANLLIERTTNASWVVVFKALITVHHLMCYGNERFTQYLASSNCAFQLSNFLDKTGTAGYDMSTYIRRYAKYLNEKALSYRTVAFDFCKVKRGKDDGTLRTMPTDKLLKTLPVLQSQLDALLEFDCSASELTNGVINTAFMLLFRDLIRLFACYNDGIIHLLEEYFEMNKKQCREALDLYKKFLIRMDKVSEFLKTAENVGVDRADIPDLSKAPSSLLDALESHLASLEGRKYVPQANGSSTVNGTSGGLDDESARLKALADEEAALAAIKEKHEAKHTNPFLASPTAEAAPSLGAAAAAAPASSGNDILDLLEAPAPPSVHHPVSKPSDDLLQLGGNPFADILSSTGPTGAASAAGSLGIFGGAPATGPNSMVNPDSIWSTPNGFDAFGTMLQPTAVGQNAGAGALGGFPATGAGAAPVPSKPATQKSLFSGDLDSTLASLADSLSIMPSSGGNKGWNSPAKQGGSKPMAAGMGWAGPNPGMSQGFRPMNPMGMGAAAPNANFMGAAPTQNLLGGGASDPFGL